MHNNKYCIGKITIRRYLTYKKGPCTYKLLEIIISFLKFLKYRSIVTRCSLIMLKEHSTNIVFTQYKECLDLSNVGSPSCHLQGGALAAFHARVRVSFPDCGGLRETKMFIPHPLLKHIITGSLRDGEVACSASDLQGLNFESCVWRAVSYSSHHLQKVLLAQFSLYVHKSSLKPDSSHITCNLQSGMCDKAAVFYALLRQRVGSTECLKTWRDAGEET